MANPLEVRWSARAIRDLESILKYLENEWTNRELRIFSTKLDKAITLIASRPKLFRATKQRKNLRRCVLSKHTTIFFLENEKSIFIVSLFDNRQDPSKI